MKLTTMPCPIEVFEELPDFHSMMERTIRLHPRLRTKDSTQRSKLGGSFIYPLNEPWPTDEITGKEYYPVLQLLEEDIPSLQGLDPIFSFHEGSDCFQLLWLPHADISQPPHIITRWLNSVDQELTEYNVAYEKGEFDSYFPKECDIYPEIIVEYPHRWALSETHERILLSSPRYLKLAEENGDGDNPLAYYQSHICCAPGSKLGGHPHWIQYPEWPMSDRGFTMDHLLTISSYEWDAADCYRWKPIEDGNSDSPEGPNDDADLMFGDCGDIYVFISRQESDWPVKAAFQCC